MNTRRNLLIALAVTPFASLAVFAQSKKPPVLIGWLSTGLAEGLTGGLNLAAFKEAMAAFGWSEGANYVLEIRRAEGRLDKLPSLAQELSAKNPALIVASPATAALAAAKAAPDIPVIQVLGAVSPVASGLAKSLARPGGMVTGVIAMVAEISEKYLELLLEAAPKIKRVGYLVDPSSPSYAAHMKTARRAAEHFRVEVRFAEVSKVDDLEPTLSRLVKDGVQGLVVLPSGWYGAERARIVNLALAQRWPISSSNSAWVEDGALLGYGIDVPAIFRRAAWYVDRVLRGAKPGDLPIEQPTTFELAVNLKTAKMLGLTMPPEIMVRATRVIQ